MNFGIIGAGGFIAPKHLQAIQDTGNTLLAAVDPHDSVGKLDSYFPEARFFTEIERFDRFLEKCRRGNRDEHIHYVSVCTPNYLHDAHIRLALRIKAHAICEKPLVISPWNLDALEDMEYEHGRRIYTVLQLRLLPSLLELKKQIEAETPREKKEICLTYVTRRGRWYDTSWKGSVEKSGGVALNIGIHFFDLLMWLFGEAESSKLHLRESRKMAGVLELERARVKWFLSTDADDLPDHVVEEGGYAYRSMTCDGQEIEFSGGFTDLHTRVYEEILAGRGTGINDARPSVELAHAISRSETESSLAGAHPSVSKVSSIRMPLPAWDASKAA
jgi:UDP-N-acetyl-2-amino-2-deoxyglucuronate dehydrogenase